MLMFGLNHYLILVRRRIGNLLTPRDARSSIIIANCAIIGLHARPETNLLLMSINSNRISTISGVIHVKFYIPRGSIFDSLNYTQLSSQS